jgi:hypothetical protein
VFVLQHLRIQLPGALRLFDRERADARGGADTRGVFSNPIYNIAPQKTKLLSDNGILDSSHKSSAASHGGPTSRPARRIARKTL